MTTTNARLTEEARPAEETGNVGGGPLQGVRVLELSQILAGPSCGVALSYLGAEVIRLESRTRLDRGRLRGTAAPDNPYPYDLNPAWTEWNAGKRGIQIDLKRPEGLALAKQLLAECDVFFYNMRQSAIDRLGLDAQTLLTEVNPRLIVMCLSGSGGSGPERDYVGYAPTFAALGGYAHISGHPGMPPLEYTGWPDVEVGNWGAFAVATALVQRDRTGNGTYIDLAGNEVFAWFTGDVLLDYAMNGRSQDRIGNRHESMAPHNIYRCTDAPEGEERWLSIAVGTEDEWAALCHAMGDPAWAADPQLATAEGRKQHEDALDAAIGAWTVNLENVALAERLQAAGVAAVPVFNGRELFESPHLRAREAYETVVHPVHGPRTMVAPPWRFSRTPAHVRGHGPLLGQDNEYVFGEILGIPQQEIARLSAANIIH